MREVQAEYLKRSNSPLSSAASLFSIHKKPATTRLIETINTFLTNIPKIQENTLLPEIIKLQEIYISLQNNLIDTERRRTNFELPMQRQRTILASAKELERERARYAAASLEYDNQLQQLREDAALVEQIINQTYTEKEVGTIESAINRLEQHYEIRDQTDIMQAENEDGCCTSCFGGICKSRRRKKQEAQLDVLAKKSEDQETIKSDQKKAYLEKIDVLKKNQKVIYQRIKEMEKPENRPKINDEDLRTELALKGGVTDYNLSVHYHALPISAMLECVRFYQYVKQIQKKIDEESIKLRTTTQPHSAANASSSTGRGVFDETTPLLTNLTNPNIEIYSIKIYTALRQHFRFSKFFERMQNQFSNFYCQESFDENSQKCIDFNKCNERFETLTFEAQDAVFNGQISEEIQKALLPKAPAERCIMYGRQRV